MDRLKQIEAFVSTAARGSLSAAARAEGVTPAIIGRRLDALEARLGVKLMVRTTRRLTLTFEGAAFLENCQRLLNDLEATAHGLLLLNPDEIVVLNAGAPPKKKQALALIAAGTGLGECILYWDGSRYRPMPSEGGHTDFAPNSDSEIDLLRHLRGSYLHVSYERIVSGPGLHAIYEYLRDTKKNEPTWLAEKIKVGNPAAEIADAGLKGQAEIAKQALDLFASIYGAEAGNLALKALTLDGVYVAGGIAPKLLKKLQDGSFMRGFTNKGRYKRIMSQIPVKVVMNDKTALLGAASMAAQLTSSTTS
jgi:glucokinase